MPETYTVTLKHPLLPPGVEITVGHTNQYGLMDALNGATHLIEKVNNLDIVRQGDIVQPDNITQPDNIQVTNDTVGAFVASLSNSSPHAKEHCCQTCKSFSNKGPHSRCNLHHLSTGPMMTCSYYRSG